MEPWLIFELLFYVILAIAVTGIYRLNKPVQMWIRSHWVMLAILTGLYTLVRLAIWGLMSLESFYQKITLATMPIQFIMMAFSSTIFVLLYVVFLQGGMARISKSKIKGDLVDVKWSDVIGMENVKEEAKEVVDLIRDRARVKKIGGKILRGIMMFGPPGCGKTYHRYRDGPAVFVHVRKRIRRNIRRSRRREGEEALQTGAGTCRGSRRMHNIHR